ncbi:MAG: AmmeMemoRadiSam system protein A [Deltaproteobacteria bacterium]|nr:AmmeMemoRadiSam system protein A [Deltaproteobacteria bacterium]
MSLSPATKQALLAYARATLAAHLQGSAAPALDPKAAAEAAQKAGAFVSLHTKGDHDLRGCIGTFSFDVPLAENVRRMAIAAGTDDPRFPPMTAAELAKVVFEISALTPPVAIQAADVVVGTHGLLVSRGMYRGVLLPQVAVDWTWSREEFLTQTCRKAGLDGDAWKEAGTKIEAFTAEVFAES